MTDLQLKEILALKKKIEELEDFLKYRKSNKGYSYIKPATVKTTYKVFSFWGYSTTIELPLAVMEKIYNEVENELLILKEQLAYL